MIILHPLIIINHQAINDFAVGLMNEEQFQRGLLIIFLYLSDSPTK